jgi:Tfp pilus assembly protein PilV
MAGFALLETLIAALLLAVGALGIAGALRGAWRATATAATSARAVAQMADLAEALRSANSGQWPEVASQWQARSGVGSVALPLPAREGVALWQARLEWTGPPATFPFLVTQTIGLLP